VLSRKVRKAAKALDVRYEFLFMQANGASSVPFTTPER
jgi:hypothetical protein